MKVCHVCSSPCYLAVAKEWKTEMVWTLEEMIGRVCGEKGAGYEGAKGEGNKRGKRGVDGSSEGGCEGEAGVEE